MKTARFVGLVLFACFVWGGPLVLPTQAGKGGKEGVSRSHKRGHKRGPKKPRKGRGNKGKKTPQPPPPEPQPEPQPKYWLRLVGVDFESRIPLYGDLIVMRPISGQDRSRVLVGKSAPDGTQKTEVVTAVQGVIRLEEGYFRVHFADAPSPWIIIYGDSDTFLTEGIKADGETPRVILDKLPREGVGLQVEGVQPELSRLLLPKHYLWVNVLLWEFEDDWFLLPIFGDTLKIEPRELSKQKPVTPPYGHASLVFHGWEGDPLAPEVWGPVPYEVLSVNSPPLTLSIGEDKWLSFEGPPPHPWVPPFLPTPWVTYGPNKAGPSGLPGVEIYLRDGERKILIADGGVLFIDGTESAFQDTWWNPEALPFRK